MGVRTHVDDLDPQGTAKSPYLFSRDCLEVYLALNKSGSLRLTLFLNHFKSKYAESALETKQANAKRRRQARGVADIVASRFPSYGNNLFAVVGDLNDEPGSEPIQPLFSIGLVDAISRIGDQRERWTHWYRGENAVAQLDYLLLSPALGAATGNAPPEIERGGLGFARYLQNGKPGPQMTRLHRRENDPSPLPVDFQFRRLSGVSPQEYASDHCPVFFEVP